MAIREGGQPPPDPAEVATLRGLRVQRMRTFEVNRQVILLPAIVRALDAGYEFNAEMSNKTLDMERRKRWRERYAEVPTAEYWQAFGRRLAIERKKP